jgi:hypothetical protein
MTKNASEIKKDAAVSPERVEDLMARSDVTASG